MGGAGSKSGRGAGGAQRAAGGKSEGTSVDLPGVEEAQEEGEIVESIVCDEGDLKDGEMREVEVGGKKVLLIKDQGEHHAIGTKCSHYGAPLAKGALCNGHVRCPWHGACFNIRTGDIEDFPGLDSVPKFQVEVEKGKVKIRARQKDLENARRVKKMACHVPDVQKTFLIVGGGGASIACAETLRQNGFQGRLVIATRENCLPYDRPKLSKAMDSKPEALALRKEDFYSAHDIEVMTKKVATSLDANAKEVKFEDGESIKYDKVFFATGGSPRELDIPGKELENVCRLRTPDDGNRISEAAKGKDVIIIGTSFIGMESAAFFAGKAKTVTVLGNSAEPLCCFGPEIGAAWKRLHVEKGVSFIAKNSAKEFVGSDGKLSHVVLQDDQKLPADVCILGIGVAPTTEFLKASGMAMNSRGFITVDKKMQTSLSDVFAGGDIVEFPLFLANDALSNVQHWQMAHQHGRIAALNMLDLDEEIKSVPFFWTQMFGKSLRYCGYGLGYDDVIIHGTPDELTFMAFYLKSDVVVAAASMGMDPLVAQVAEMMLSGEPLMRNDIKDDPKAFVSRLIE